MFLHRRVVMVVIMRSLLCKIINYCVNEQKNMLFSIKNIPYSDDFVKNNIKYSSFASLACET